VSFPVTFKGRLGRDPEMSYVGKGTAMVKLSVATNRRKLVDGSWQDVDTSWWRVTAFGETAEYVAAEARKGDLVMVAGYVKIREWEDPKDGSKRSTAEVTADDVAVIPKRPKAGAGASADPWAAPAVPTDEAPF